MSSQISVHWFSRKGDARGRNSDACAVFSNGSYVFVIIGDASEKGRRGHEFVRRWMASVVDQASLEVTLSCEVILRIMREIHQQLRIIFTSSRACWSALFIDHKNEQVWTFSCGDCRIGTECENGTVTWLTPVHSQANWRGEEFVLEHAMSTCRHHVTRTLNPKRFVNPEILEIKYEAQARWVLATDGYWIEQKMERVPIHNLQDDASFFRISNTKNIRRIETDSDNYYHI